MDDLVRFLRERYDEEAQAAQKASELCGCHPPKPSWNFGDDKTDGRILVEDEPHPGIKRRIGRQWSGTYEGLFMAQHIVRHDPARVLAEVEAKRQILALHGGNLLRPPMFCAHCEHDTPCPTLRLLALSYADHPGYREQWRPEPA